MVALTCFHSTKQIGTAIDMGMYVTYHQEPHHGDVNRKGMQNAMSKNSEAAEW
jgi:hypothetical protein